MSSSTRCLLDSVLPRQGLWSLTAGLDALDLVAIHDEFILLTDLHVMLEAAMHGVVPFLNQRDSTKNEIQTHSSLQTILTATEGKSALSQSILHSVENKGRTIRIPCKPAASFDTQNTPHQWTYQPHPPRPTWFPRGSGRKWPSRPISRVSRGWEAYLLWKSSLKDHASNAAKSIDTNFRGLNMFGFVLGQTWDAKDTKHHAICGKAWDILNFGPWNKLASLNFFVWLWTFLGFAEWQKTSHVRRRRLKAETRVFQIFPKYTVK